MRCSNCAVEAGVQQGPCPNCGAFISSAPRESFGKRQPALLIAVSLAAFLAVAGSVGFVVYALFKPGGILQTVRERQSRFNSGLRARKSRYPVEHGKVLGPEDIRGHGTLYFVPVGTQAIHPQSLADYYKEKFGADITVLPPVAIQPSDCVPDRRQCVAEELEAEMTAAYSDIARNPDSVMIALTDEDIFPRELGWEFTYSLHSARFGIVSTRRMDPAFWGGPHDEAVRLASTRQMLTKYVAMLYYRIPDSFDPTSVMYTPLTPDGGSDDLHESDLHPEASVNGRRGSPYPCLFFTYSYQAHELKSQDPALTDCRNSNVAHADEETLELDLGLGRITERSMDLHLDSTPAIDFRRGYISDFVRPMAMGMGTNHTFNTYLSSDGASALTYISVVHEDGWQDYLNRLTPGRGFSTRVEFESREDGIRGARMTWDSGDFKLSYRDGSWSTFLPCNDGTCYWTGYQDAKGNTLKFERGPQRQLLQVTASDRQGVSFQSDPQLRITEATATDGKSVAYGYDDKGCLARVRRADGQETVYAYDSAHRMTSVSVVTAPGAHPEQIISIEYDARGRVVKLTLTGLGTYAIEYLATNGQYATDLHVTDPDGQILHMTIDADDYVVHAQAVRFPRVVAHR